jgi:hypothetical protein
MPGRIDLDGPRELLGHGDLLVEMLPATRVARWCGAPALMPLSGTGG